ncbi:holo-[acyl-carrier-protein] synthase [Clostridia bacterium]|nr:holo-[acyl-carrier-protein] synthase [Clostridia bacterium]
MIGVDILEIERMRRPAASPHFMERVFTEREREYLSTRGVQSAAGLFCAKEAVSKALGFGLLRVNPHTVEILHTPSGQPYAEYGGQRIAVSISHTKTTAVAVAAIE